MNRYFLRTERLGFAHWSAGDLPLALALWGDPKVMRFIGGPFTNEEIRDRLDREIALSREYKVQYWPIFLLENQEHAGCAGLRPYRIEDLVYELGFIYDRRIGVEVWQRRRGVQSSNLLSRTSVRTRFSPDITQQILRRNGCY